METDYENARAELLKQEQLLDGRLVEWLKQYDAARAAGTIDYGHIGSLNKTAFDLKQILAIEDQPG